MLHRPLACYFHPWQPELSHTPQPSRPKSSPENSSKLSSASSYAPSLLSHIGPYRVRESCMDLPFFPGMFNGEFWSAAGSSGPEGETVPYELWMTDDILTPENTNWEDRVKMAYCTATVAPESIGITICRSMKNPFPILPFHILKLVQCVLGCPVQGQYGIWLFPANHTSAWIRTSTITDGTSTSVREWTQIYANYVTTICPCSLTPRKSPDANSKFFSTLDTVYISPNDDTTTSIPGECTLNGVQTLGREDKEGRQSGRERLWRMRFTPSIVRIETTSLRFRRLLFCERRQWLQPRLRMVLSRLQAGMGQKVARVRVLKRQARRR